MIIHHEQHSKHFILWIVIFRHLLAIIPPLQRSWKEGILVSPCPSACPSGRPSVCPSVDRIVSAPYIQQYSPDPFHIYTSYQATLDGVSHVKLFFQNLKIRNFGIFFLICNFDFVLFWPGIQYEPIVWVIMRRRGYPQSAGVLVVLVEN